MLHTSPIFLVPQTKFLIFFYRVLYNVLHDVFIGIHLVICYLLLHIYVYLTGSSHNGFLNARTFFSVLQKDFSKNCVLDFKVEAVYEMMLSSCYMVFVNEFISFFVKVLHCLNLFFHDDLLLPFND